MPKTQKEKQLSKEILDAFEHIDKVLQKSDVKCNIALFVMFPDSKTGFSISDIDNPVLSEKLDEIVQFLK